MKHSGLETLAQWVSSRQPKAGPAMAPAPAAAPQQQGPDFAETVGKAMGAGVSKAMAGYAASRRQKAAAEALQQRELAAYRASIQAPGAAGQPGGVQWGPNAQQYMGQPMPQQPMQPMQLQMPQGMPQQMPMMLPPGSVPMMPNTMGAPLPTIPTAATELQMPAWPGMGR